MTPVTVVWRYLQGRFVTSVLTVVSVALGVSLVIASVLLTRGIKEGFIAGATDYNLIVGAKGSPTQLVLNVIFRMDAPTPNIPLSAYEDLRRDPRVEVAVPVAMGDAYQGFRYVATSEAYFAPFPWRRHAPALSTGRLFRSEAPERPDYEAVLGADVARRTALKASDRFYEGEEMAAYPLTVVGVLRPTGTADDRAIFISLASYWEMNEVSRRAMVKPLTAVLVRPRRLSDLTALHRGWNVAPDLQAALPSAVLLNVFNLLGLVEDVLFVVLTVVAVVVGLYLFVTMYNATLERRREIATMRALGARRATVLGIVLLESCVIAALGGLAGILGGHGVAALGAYLLAARGGPVTHALALGALQPATFGAVVALGALAGLVPAVLAYRTEVAENLAPL
ncbi:MAG TPA: ABC transporter permease [Methylomirabilota bacterium]